MPAERGAKVIPFRKASRRYDRAVSRANQRGKMAKLIAMSTAVLVVALAAASASANTHGCYYPYGHGPQNDQNVPIGNVSVQNMSCREALTAISNGTLLRNGNLRTPHFGCHILSSGHAGNVLTGADIRCSHRSPSKAFRFSWAT